MFTKFLILVMVTVDVIKVHETEKCHSQKFKSNVLHGLYFFRDNVFFICLQSFLMTLFEVRSHRIILSITLIRRINNISTFK